MSQQVLPLLPADATPIGPLAGLVETAEGGVVFVCGEVSFAWAAGDETARRLAAVQLVAAEIASAVAVAAAFAVTTVTLWRWRSAFTADGVAGLLPVKPGPRGPSKLTDALAARIRRLDGQGLGLAAIAGRCAVSTATVRVALGRTVASPAPTDPDDADAEDIAEVAEPDNSLDDEGEPLPVLPAPTPRLGEPELARWGLLDEAPVVFTPGAHLPLAGLLLILPALATTGLLEVFEAVYGRLRNGFYGLRVGVLTMLFLALLREPRAEGATRIRPADLGRVLGLDRAPEVKTLRRKLAELAGHRRGADLQAALAKAHATARPQALGFLHVDGHTRAYFGTRDLPKTHIARLHLASHASAETWIADADADPVMVVTAIPGASLASELLRLIPDLRAILGEGRHATVIFDRGGWSATVFAALIDAGLGVLTYRKGDFEPLPDGQFCEQSFTDPDRQTYTWPLAETTVALPVGDGSGKAVTLRQIHKLTDTGRQIPILTSQDDLPAAELCWRLSRRWRQENYLKYARTHFPLDALDSYADTDDDPDRLVPNPAKKPATAAIDASRAELAAAEADLACAVDDAAHRAGQPGNSGQAIVDPAPRRAVTIARTKLDRALAARRDTPARLPLRQVRPDAQLLNEERKLVTHAIRMAAYNAESTLTRALHAHYTRADDEARALLREAFTLSGDIHITGDELDVRLDPASAPHRSRAIAALCEQLTATETTYPGTSLKIVYSVKDHPDAS
ncbi:MAG: helix-turn-helix domain-containing protein [Jatrophihabitantaceae bacterium]